MSWVSLMHGHSSITVLIEEPDWPRTRIDDSRYVAAELTPAQAAQLRDDLDRRIREVTE